MSRCRASHCPVCGCQTLVDEYTEAGVYAPHAALPATERVRAAHPGPWPICEHGTLYRSGCRNQPVLPACCCAPGSVDFRSGCQGIPDAGQTTTGEM